MDLLHRIVDWVARPQRKQLVNQVASTSLEKVWRRVAHRVTQMRPAVARGYIRARAIGVVGHHCEALSWQYPRLRRHADQIRADALEQVVRRLADRAVRLRSGSHALTATRRAA